MNNTLQVLIAQILFHLTSTLCSPTSRPDRTASICSALFSKWPRSVRNIDRYGQGGLPCTRQISLQTKIPAHHGKRAAGELRFRTWRYPRSERPK
ncbi:hypothetical protein V8F20_009063 [Naviculisporaceae sp. PSN 640]